MRRKVLSLFLTLLTLISVGGAVSIVGAASHVTPGQVLKPTLTHTTVSMVSLSPSPTPQLTSTSLNAMASATSAVVGSEITIYGRLTFHALPVTGQPVILYRSTDNVRFTAVNVTMTTENGNYAFARTEQERGTYYYRTEFAGGYPYDPAMSEVLSVQFNLLL
ncbi:MAG TPA: hypothetical protein VEG44_05035 [Candidatus Acidoferrales bacterium]|nr:hypothetical protein [Candidatus Acidoferrales bacterium]